MTDYPLKESTIRDAHEPGEYWFETTGGREFVTIICPRCGKPDRCVNHTIVQRSPLTIRASFLCAQIIPDGSRRTCGLHAWVTDGVMREC